MLVRTWKTVDVECECEIAEYEILHIFSQKVDESTPDYWGRMLPVLHYITKILAEIPDETIQAVRVEHRCEVHKRLELQAKRWGDA